MAPKQIRWTSKSGPRSAGCTILVFMLFFLAGGIFTAVIIFNLVVPIWRAHFDFIENTCVVDGNRLGETRGQKGVSYRPEIHFRYTVNGREYSTWGYDPAGVYGGKSDAEAIVRRFEIGRQYPCWVDPDDPTQAVLDRGGFHWWYILFLIPLLFMLIGMGGFIGALRRRGSPESLAASALTQTSEGVRSASDFSFVPAIDLTNHPGQVLPYRLPADASAGCVIGFILVFALFWNGITSIFVIMAVYGHLTGQADWCLTIFLIPFVTIGLLTILGFFWGVLTWMGRRPVFVEIDSHPVATGKPWRLRVEQHGRLRLRKFRVLLVCEEMVRSGPKEHSETKRCHEIEVFQGGDITIAAGAAFDWQGSATIPASAMHSFKAQHNEVRWKVLIEAFPVGWPRFTCEFPFVVLPGNARANS